MSQSRTSSADPSADQQEFSPTYGASHGANPPEPALRPQKPPSVSRLFARMFGANAAEAHQTTFAKTEWLDTEWQDTRSPPPEA
jgi:hypothetical protein